MVGEPGVEQEAGRPLDGPPLDDAGRVVSIVMILAGVTIFAYVATMLVEICASSLPPPAEKRLHLPAVSCSQSFVRRDPLGLHRPGLVGNLARRAPKPPQALLSESRVLSTPRRRQSSWGDCSAGASGSKTKASIDDAPLSSDPLRKRRTVRSVRSRSSRSFAAGTP